MPRIDISSISNGMDLQNSDFEIGPGFSKESLGLDYGTPGIVKPMRAATALTTFPKTIADQCIVYVGANRYMFTTTADGLYVTDITSGFPADHTTSTIIHATFTGTFKALPINDQYVILANATLMRKWAPGLSTTYQLGLNTPPTPTLALGTAKTKTIDDMDTSPVAYTATGGGVGYGAVARDTAVKMQGTSSIKITQRKKSTVVVSKTFVSTPLDLSKYSSAGDLGISFICFSFFMDDPTLIDVMQLTFSCASDGAFDKDAYTVTLSPSVMSQAQPTAENINSDIYGEMIRGTYDPESGESVSFNLPLDSIASTAGPIEEYTVISVINRRTRSYTVNGSWVTVKIMVDEFQRIGVSSGRNWSTITGIRWTLTSVKKTDVVSMDTWIDDVYMIGGGNLWGTYWVAVAYQNAYGNYGPYSAFAGPIEVEGVPLTISGLTVDSDAQTTKRRIAIIGGSITVPMVHTLADNTTTSLTYNSADSVLTVEERRWNNQKAPSGCRDIINFQGRIWLVGVPSYKNRLIYSEELYYEAFPYANYRILGEGEDLYQVASVGDYVAARGAGKEYLTYPVGETHLYWRTVDGAPEGAVSSRMLLKLSESEHVYSSRKGFFKSGPNPSYVLQKVGAAVGDFTAVRGVQAGQFCYIAFTDTASVTRVLRLDLRLGTIIPHYVANISPGALYTDPVTKTAYYTAGAVTYSFDSASGPLATKLVIPGQFLGNTRLKEFPEILYKLTSGPLTLTMVRDGTADSTTISLANNEDEFVSLPHNSVKALGLILESTSQDFVLTLPITLEADLVE
jgi:hypothetical protein